MVLGGCGAGAALAAALACGARGLRGLALLAPPLLTAEGARDAADDPLHEVLRPLPCSFPFLCHSRMGKMGFGAAISKTTFNE